jgi:phosphate transport system permease protein
MRRLKNLLLFVVCATCALISCGALLLVVGLIMVRGLPAISWHFLTEQIRLVGAAGGIFYNAIGTLILTGTALTACAPLALGTGLLCGVYLRNSPWRNRLSVLLYVLNGVPSILFGIIGFIIFVKFFDWGKSWLTGGLLLGFMIVPTASIAFVERIEAIPPKYVEAACGLGMRTSQTIWSVVVPQSLSGLMSGSLLGLARAAGEVAPIMFTATIFAGATVPHGIRESPVLSLPYHIFVLAQDSFDQSINEKLWATAGILVGIVFLLSILALPIRLRLHEEGRVGG